MKYWSLYIPDTSLPWTRRRVAHLHRRVAFGAPPEVIERDLAGGSATAVIRLLHPWTSSEPSPFEQTATLIGNAAVDSGSPDRLKAWWIYRCLFSPQPLVERLTLMWHNHFATSNLKVDDLKLMKQQNETLRQHAFSPFGVLLAEMVRDPALLVWLDAPSNQKGKPNENLARELLELFSLGIGHYTEADVREVARALTGRTVRQGQFHERAAAHDDGEKTCLGKTGPWTGDDVVRLLVEHPATSQRLAWRLTTEFFGEGVVNQAALDELAAGLREHQLDIQWAVSTILNSRLFFSDANIATRVCDPVTFLLAPLRSLELTRDPPSTLVLAEWLSRMGQDLFYPPNVGGWTGGRGWLSTRTVIARANYVSALTEGRLAAAGTPPDLSQLLATRKVQKPKDALDQLSTRLFGQADEKLSSRLCELQGSDAIDSASIGKAVVALLTSPAAHVH